MNTPWQTTIRQQIIRHLETQPMTARQISQAVRISEKDVYFHLSFIEKTLRNQHKQFKTAPCTCLNCGFEFSHRKNFKKPGRCPGCRHSRITSAVYRIIHAL
jgi:predicted Zn-ribbon and HTH transcriptional regulator